MTRSGSRGDWFVCYALDGKYIEACLRLQTRLKSQGLEVPLPLPPRRIRSPPHTLPLGPLAVSQLYEKLGGSHLYWAQSVWLLSPQP